MACCVLRINLWRHCLSVIVCLYLCFFFFSSRRRHTRSDRDWSSDVCSSDLVLVGWRAITTLPVQQYPNIQSSSVLITTVYYGASAETVRGFLTTPIERAEIGRESCRERV